MKFKSVMAAMALSALGSLLATGSSWAAGNLYETLKSDPQFSTLVSVIDAAGVRSNYTGGARTVFAPTNAAFDKVKGGYQDMLGKTDRENTRALLLYQMLPGTHTVASFAGKSMSYNTMQKASVTITGTADKLHFGDEFGADQAGPALTASNGVIIPVDTVPVTTFETGDDGVAVPPPVTTVTPLN